MTATDTATGTINDDDSAAVTIDNAAASEGDQITFTVTLDNAVKGGFTVTPGFTDVSATEGTDYAENTDDITFAGTAGETQTFTVDTTEDTGVEPTETFTVSLAVSGTTLTVTSTDTATGTINDDDSTAVTIENAAATEGGQITFTVTLNQAVSGGFKVTPGFTDGSTDKDTDYAENTDAITFAGTAGETQTFTVDTTEDTELEPAETFTVGLTVSDTTAQVTATDTATGTINDDDSAAVTIDNAAASEGDQITFTVTLDNAVKGGFTVTPGFTDVSATEGTDYAENTDDITFAGTAGETQTFTVDTTEDTGVEPTETFTVSLAVSGHDADGDLNRHRHRHHQRRRQHRRHDRERRRHGGRPDHLHGDPQPGGFGRLQGHPGLHRRQHRQGHRLRREHRRHHLRRHRRRDPDLHRRHHRGHRARTGRDLHRGPDGVGHHRPGDRHRHRHRHHQRR